MGKQNKTKQNKTNKTKQTKQNKIKTKQNKTKQNKTKQNQNKTKQNNNGKILRLHGKKSGYVLLCFNCHHCWNRDHHHSYHYFVTERILNCWYAGMLVHSDGRACKILKLRN